METQRPLSLTKVQIESLYEAGKAAPNVFYGEILKAKNKEKLHSGWQLQEEVKQASHLTEDKSVQLAGAF